MGENNEVKSGDAVQSNDVVKNVHGNTEQEEYQKKLSEKAHGLVAYMNEEPKAQLVPTLQVTERGIIPDARIVLLGDDKKEEDERDELSEEAEDASEGDDSERSDPAEATEPAKA